MVSESTRVAMNCPPSDQVPAPESTADTVSGSPMDEVLSAIRTNDTLIALFKAVSEIWVSKVFRSGVDFVPMNVDVQSNDSPALTTKADLLREVVCRGRIRFRSDTVDQNVRDGWRKVLSARPADRRTQNAAILGLLTCLDELVGEILEKMRIRRDHVDLTKSPFAPIVDAGVFPLWSARNRGALRLWERAKKSFSVIHPLSSAVSDPWFHLRSAVPNRGGQTFPVDWHGDRVLDRWLDRAVSQRKLRITLVPLAAPEPLVEVLEWRLVPQSGQIRFLFKPAKALSDDLKRRQNVELKERLESVTRSDDAHLVVFPELTVHDEVLEELKKVVQGAKRDDPNMPTIPLVVAGSYHQGHGSSPRNEGMVLRPDPNAGTPFHLFHVRKSYPVVLQGGDARELASQLKLNIEAKSAFAESPVLIEDIEAPPGGYPIQILDTSIGRIALVICRDGLDENEEIVRLLGELRVDLLLIPSMNPGKLDRFQTQFGRLTEKLVGVCWVNVLWPQAQDQETCAVALPLRSRGVEGASQGHRCYVAHKTSKESGLAGIGHPSEIPGGLSVDLGKLVDW